MQIMKKIIVILVITILIFTAGSASAADPLYRMVNPEYFPGDQDAMIVGQIVSLDQNNFRISVLKVLNGSMSSDSILVEKNFTYLSFSEAHAVSQVGDFCIMAIKKDDDIYKVIYPDRVVKANSGDYATLKCLYEDVYYGATDVPAIQWYANTDGAENGFGFGSGRAYVTRPNGEILDITDIAVKVSYDKSGNPVYSEPLDYEVVNPQTNASIPHFTLAFILLLCGYFLIKLRKRLLYS